jgi:hypothetical protein
VVSLRPIGRGLPSDRADDTLNTAGRPQMRWSE